MYQSGAYTILMLFSGLDDAKKEIEALKKSVNTLERTKREHVQSKQV